MAKTATLGLVKPDYDQNIQSGNVGGESTEASNEDILDAAIAALQKAAVKTVTLTLTAAQILAIGATAVQILPAPGAGLAYQVLSVLAHYRFKTTAYTLGSMTEFVFLCSGGNPQAAILVAAFLSRVLDVFESAAGSSAETSSTGAAAINQPLNILSDASPTLGDGTVTFTLRYLIVDTTIS